jgi:general secretion pathway protein J
MEWDGRVMRITRQHSQDPKAGVQVVAWTLGNGQWTRWQSEPLMQNDAWTQAWTQAQIWAESAGNLKANTAQEVVIHPVQAWQIYFHRDGAWTNALSSDVNTNSNTNGKSSLQNLPEGLRLVLELADRPEIHGKVTMDWVRPTFTAVKQ